MKKFSSWLVTHSLNGPLHVRSTMEREVDVATFAPNADGVELKHRSPAGLGEAAARADRGADPPTCALYSPADLPVGTRRRRGPYEDDRVPHAKIAGLTRAVQPGTVVLRLRINHWRQGGDLLTVRACKLRATCRRAPDCSETCEELYIEGYDWWKTVRLRIWETSRMEVNRRTLRGELSV